MDETAVNWSSWLEHAALTDVGMRRASNQDAMAVVMAADTDEWLKRGHLLLVADGMGAHAAGELASKMAADGIPHSYHKFRDRSPPDALRKAIEEINAQIHHRGQTNAEFQGMGTTCSALLLLPQGAIAGHVGDSRIYRLRGDKLEQLTFDHSLVWEMMAAGQMSQDAVPSFIPKNIITRSLGPHPQVQVDLEGPFPLQAGDRFLICSDGLTGQVRDDELAVILGCLQPSEVAGVLIDIANLRGGPDNITLVVAAITSETFAGLGRSEPLWLDGDQLPAPEHPSPVKWWAAAAASVLVAVGLGIAGWTVAAGGLLVLALGLAATGVVLRFGSSGREHRELAPGRMLGKGPHTATSAVPSAEVAQRLQQMVEQLNSAAVDGNWVLDWHGFKSEFHRGREASREAKYADAVRAFCSAIHLMMRQIREQGLRNPAIKARGGEVA